MFVAMNLYLTAGKTSIRSAPRGARVQCGLFLLVSYVPYVLFPRSILNSLKSSRLELVTWKAATICLFDAHPDTVLISERVSQCARRVLKRTRRFDLDREIIHPGDSTDVHFVLGDVRHTANQVINRTRIQIHSAHYDHIV